MYSCEKNVHLRATCIIALLVLLILHWFEISPIMCKLYLIDLLNYFLVTFVELNFFLSRDFKNYFRMAGQPLNMPNFNNTRQNDYLEEYMDELLLKYSL